MLNAQAIDSKTVRLTWDDPQDGSIFGVLRNTTSDYNTAEMISDPLAVGATVFNDYEAEPETEYWYWLVNQVAAVLGPTMTVTPEAPETKVALGEEQRDALVDWAWAAGSKLYPVMWRYQPASQPLKPSTRLNVISIRRAGLKDYRAGHGDELRGQRSATCSVLVVSDPQPPQRALVTIGTVQQGEYTIVVDGDQTVVSFDAAPPDASTVAKAIVEALIAKGYGAILTGDEPGEGLAFESKDPRAPFTVTVSSNMTLVVAEPVTAQDLAQAMMDSLSDPSVLEQLADAGISVGTVNDINDLSGAFETRDELRAQFDFTIGVASTLAVQEPVIDTVTSTEGTFL